MRDGKWWVEWWIEYIYKWIFIFSFIHKHTGGIIYDNEIIENWCKICFVFWKLLVRDSIGRSINLQISGNINWMLKGRRTVWKAFKGRAKPTEQAQLFLKYWHWSVRKKEFSILIMGFFLLFVGKTEQLFSSVANSIQIIISLDRIIPNY